MSGAGTAALVVGLGQPDAGDDAVGRAVARALVDRTGVDVLELDDPTELLDVWSGRELVVVVDAVRSGSEPGAVVRIEAGERAAPLTSAAAEAVGRGGTHAVGLGTVIELGRALGRLPRRLVVVGVEGADFRPGARLSPAVLAAVDRAVDAVDAVLTVS